jgi:tetrahydromethanopterin S-methyltransferase subunit B
MTKNNDTLLMAIGELKGTITGIVTQMTVANGRTSKLEAKVESLEKSRDEDKGKIEAVKESRAIHVSRSSLIIAATGVLIGLVGFISTFLSVWVKGA